MRKLSLFLFSLAMTLSAAAQYVPRAGAAGKDFSTPNMFGCVGFGPIGSGTGTHGAQTLYLTASGGTLQGSSTCGGTTGMTFRIDSMIASGIFDGTTPVSVSTGASCALGTAGGCNATAYSSGYTFNQATTATTAVTYTLPVAAAGKQYCVSNSVNASNATATGAITIQTSGTGQFIIFSDGTLSGSGGNVKSGGAGGDAGCVVGVDATHWYFYYSRGTWTKT